MEITLTLNLTTENLEKLKVFCEETGAATKKKPAAKSTVNAKAETSQPKKEPAETTAKEDSTPKAFTLTDVRAVALKLSKAGKSDTLKEIFAKFGAAKLSEVPKESYAELMEELTNA